MAELLIALAILGIIATFAIPKVLQAQQDGKKQAIFKETISALSQSLNEGLMNGRVCTSPRTYFASSLNALKLCKTDLVAEGCWDTGAPVQDPWGMLLPNGAALVDFDTSSALDCGPSGAPGQSESIFIDWNGPLPPNVLGDDIINMTIGYTTDATVRRGEVMPNGAASRTLMGQIFQ